LGEGDACRPEVGKAGCGVSELKRLILDYRGGELIARVLHRSSLDGPGPNTKARRREVEQLAREGLHQALASLEGDPELVGTSGFTTREDLLSVALPRPDELREAAAWAR
jgi:hypothetical protein